MKIGKAFASVVSFFTLAYKARVSFSRLPGERGFAERTEALDAYCDHLDSKWAQRALSSGSREDGMTLGLHAIMGRSVSASSRMAHEHLTRSGDAGAIGREFGEIADKAMDMSEGAPGVWGRMVGLKTAQGAYQGAALMAAATGDGARAEDMLALAESVWEAGLSSTTRGDRKKMEKLREKEFFRTNFLLASIRGDGEGMRLVVRRAVKALGTDAFVGGKGLLFEMTGKGRLGKFCYGADRERAEGILGEVTRELAAAEGFSTAGEAGGAAREGRSLDSSVPVAKKAPRAHGGRTL